MGLLIAHFLFVYYFHVIFITVLPDPIRLIPNVVTLIYSADFSTGMNSIFSIPNRIFNIVSCAISLTAGFSCLNSQLSFVV